MYLEGVIVCVNYSDFLAHTLPQNKQMFNKLVVVTDTKDTDTKNLCEYHHVQCIQTDVFYENGDVFNKGKGINEVIKALTGKGWIIHLDADIYLPPLTRTILEKIPLNNKVIYGIDRMMCPNFKSWIKFLEKPVVHEAWVYVHVNYFEMGVRICQYMGDGYTPIGYFQMWNPIGSGVYYYPTEHGEADRTDVLMAKRFSRENRILIPELISIHLESEGLNMKEMGKNWKGRKTSPFGILNEVLSLTSSLGYALPWYKRLLTFFCKYFTWISKFI